MQNFNYFSKKFLIKVQKFIKNWHGLPCFRPLCLLHRFSVCVFFLTFFIAYTVKFATAAGLVSNQERKREKKKHTHKSIETVTLSSLHATTTTWKKTPHQ